MQELKYIPFLAAFVTLSGAWFLLLACLFRALEVRHPSVYQALGRPDLLHRNGPEQLIALLKFLTTRQHTRLADRSLGLLGDLLLVIFTLQSALLLTIAGLALLFTGK